MRWKLIIQFLIMVLVISVASNLINTVVMSFYMDFVNSGGVPEGFFVSARPARPSHTQIAELKDDVIYINIDEKKNLEEKKGWYQIIDNKGTEVQSFNKPVSLKISYSDEELNILESEGLQINPRYTITTTRATTAAILNDDVDGQYKVNVYTLRNDERQVVYNMLVGYPRESFSFSMLFYSFINYFTSWPVPKLISSALTVLFALVLGFFFARGISKPVIKITEGIQRASQGELTFQYPEKGIYRNVFKNLNHLRDTLNKNNLEVQRTERMREDWIINLTHDLKTPLSSIKGYSELLSDSDYAIDKSESEKFLSIISQKALYIESLLEDLKFAQKLKNDLLPIKLEKQNLVEAVREVCIDILNNPDFSGREINFNTVEENIEALYDKNLLRRALTNILLNALNHNPSSTTVNISVLQRGEKFEIIIEDDGEGIAEKDMPMLFERYYRGTNTSKDSGSGLGLAIAKQIIEAHRGTVEVTSQLGKGTKFTVII